MSAALVCPNPAADAPKTWYSPEEYLAFDNAAEGRFEYTDGRITPVGAPGIVNVLDPMCLTRHFERGPAQRIMVQLVG